MLWWLLWVFFGGDVFRAASGPGFSPSGLLVLPVLSVLSAFGYSVGRCDGLPVVGVPAVVLVFFPFRDSLLSFFIFWRLLCRDGFGICGRRSLFGVRSFGLLLLAVMGLFYPTEYKKSRCNLSTVKSVKSLVKYKRFFIKKL